MSRKTLVRARRRCLLAAAALWPVSGRTQPALGPAEIRIGLSAPLSGLRSAFGQHLQQGVAMGLRAVNAAGGVHGRRLRLDARDDGNDPGRLLRNMRDLLMAGAAVLTGAPAAGEAAGELLPMLQSAGVPLIGVASGAENLRQPPHRLVFNLRAGAQDEAAALVYQLDTLGVQNVGVIAQTDAFGSSSLAGMELELMRLSLRPSAVARLAPDATNERVKAGIDAVREGGTQCLVLAVRADLVRRVRAELRARGWGVQCYLMSDACDLLSPDFLGDAAGCGVSQVVPHPRNIRLPLVAEFQHLRAASEPETHAALEGWIYARVVGEALRRAGRDAPADRLVAALEGGIFDLGGYRLQFSPQERRGTRFTELLFIDRNGALRR